MLSALGAIPFSFRFMKTSTLPTCRNCGARLNHTFVDLGMSPLANSYLKAAQLNQMEPFYPLHVRVCASCFLVQLEPVAKPEEIFSDYAYFSSYSDSWLEHAKSYTEAVVRRFGLSKQNWVVEIASNDGYLLQYFVEKGVPVLGIEPARNVAEEAVRRGIPTEVRFFGGGTARDLTAGGKHADLIIGNNVLAHVPDLNDFVFGLKILLAPQGVITLEFPHLMRLMEENQFDTIYHEHLSYFSLIAARYLFDRHRLRIFDVEELPTHGGSLRIYACHQENVKAPAGDRIADLLSRELKAGFETVEHYLYFSERVKKTKRKLLEFLIAAKGEGKSIVGYGAPAKGNTLLNYCGIRTDLLDYTVDRSPHKQEHFLPGTRIPIYPPEKINETQPEYVMILPWNLKEEVMGQMRYIRDWGGKFVVPIPEVKIL
jgi:2-polyprenyl-3-methyl-5-hydroxy-6-metoxy-1,4-benzoquinol methylase